MSARTTLDDFTGPSNELSPTEKEESPLNPDERKVVLSRWGTLWYDVAPGADPVHKVSIIALDRRARLYHPAVIEDRLMTRREPE